MGLAAALMGVARRIKALWLSSRNAFGGWWEVGWGMLVGTEPAGLGLVLGEVAPQMLAGLRGDRVEGFWPTWFIPESSPAIQPGEGGSLGLAWQLGLVTGLPLCKTSVGLFPGNAWCRLWLRAPWM